MQVNPNRRPKSYSKQHLNEQHLMQVHKSLHHEYISTSRKVSLKKSETQDTKRTFRKRYKTFIRKIHYDQTRCILASIQWLDAITTCLKFRMVAKWYSMR